jgi:hypothetical protein
MHFLNCIITSHVDSTLLTDGDYQILPKPEVEVSEDIGNITEDLTEAPNQSSEEFVNVSDPSPASEGKPGHKLATLFALQSTFIYILVH